MRHAWSGTIHVLFAFAVLAAASPPGALAQTDPGHCTELADLHDMIACERRSQEGRAARCAEAPAAKLVLPVQGRRLLSYGDKTAYGTTSRGHVFETAGATQVRSPAAGVVLFAGEFRSYGKLVIVDACTIDVLIAGAAGVSVTAGDLVAAGDALGTMSSAPGAALYLEVRENGRAIDPTPLLGAN